MKKLMVISVGSDQTPIVKTAKAQGMYVIVASNAYDEPEISEADEFVYCDIYDIESMVEFASEHAVDGVLTDQSDLATPVAAQIADRLGLPGVGIENSLIFTDKSKMREVFKILGLPLAEYYLTDHVESAVSAGKKIGFPVVIKPPDAAVSRGVHVVLNEDELRDRYADSLSYSRQKKVIVEKYIRGPQFFSQGYADHGKLNLFAFSDRYYFDIPDACIPYTNAFPALIDDSLKARMTEAFSKVIARLGLPYGQVWAEWIYDDQEDILYLNEMACRGAGALVTTDVIPNAYGIDTQVFLVNDAVGNHKDWFQNIELQHNAAAFYSFLLPPGTVTKVEGLDRILSIPGITSYRIKPIAKGDVTEPFRNKSSRFGSVVMKGNTRAELDKIREEVIKTVNIEITDKNGMIRHPIWD